MLHSTHPLAIRYAPSRNEWAYTKKGFTERSKYGKSYLSRIENGYVHPTNTTLLNWLASALHLSSNETIEFFKAAVDSQKFIQIPPDVDVRGYKVVHGFMRAFVDAGEDELGRIEQFLLEECVRRGDSRRSN